MKTLLTSMAGLLALAFLPAQVSAQDATAVAEGARLYGQNCVRCHSARSPMERTDREWVTIVNHMRARANMTRSQARALTVFLQETNRPETGAATRGVPAQGSQEPEEGPETTEDPPVARAQEGAALPVLVLVDLADPEMSEATRNAVKSYLKGIRNP